MGLKHLSVVTGGLESRSGGLAPQHQAAGWLRTQEKGVSVSLYWIYQLIAEDRARGGDLYLRRKGKKAPHEDGHGSDAEPGGD